MKKKTFTPQNHYYLGYTVEEMEEFQTYVSKTMRPADEYVLHDKVNLCNIHIDILYFSPTEQDPYIHLLTMGAGAYLMSNGKRAEFMITLPPNWPMDAELWENENNYWPIRLLQDAARFSIANNAFLDSFHTLENQKPYAPNTLQHASIFIPQEKLTKIQLSLLKCVEVLQIVPLTNKELANCANRIDNIRVACCIPVLPTGFYVIDPSRQN